MVVAIVVSTSTPVWPTSGAVSLAEETVAALNAGVSRVSRKQRRGSKRSDLAASLSF